jgi:hypothetical protein
VGYRHLKPNSRRCRRRLRPRLCLRKGCGRRYTPKRWNQRYCQDPECLRLVRRWQATKRQAKRRQDEAVKARHARAQQARRRRVPASPQPPNEPEVAAARGHAARIFSPTPICDRPGCHQTPPKLGRNQAKFCCLNCRQALRRVLDRERKWLKRGTFQGRQAREREYQAARERRCGKPGHSAGVSTPQAAPP